MLHEALILRDDTFLCKHNRHQHILYYRFYSFYLKKLFFISIALFKICSPILPQSIYCLKSFGSISFISVISPSGSETKSPYGSTIQNERVCLTILSGS